MRVRVVSMCLALFVVAPLLPACGGAADVMVPPPPPPPPAPARAWYSGTAEPASTPTLFPAPAPALLPPPAPDPRIQMLRTNGARDLACPVDNVVAAIRSRADTGKSIYLAEGCGRRALYLPVNREPQSAGSYLMLTSVVSVTSPDPV